MTVEVSAASVQLQTESAEVSNLIGAAQTQALPLNGRVFSQLVELVPGVVSDNGSIGGGTGLSSDLCLQKNPKVRDERGTMSIGSTRQSAE
jgi:hypothetical protein